MYLACFVVSTYEIFILVCWILMGYVSSTTYLLARLQEKFSSCEPKEEWPDAGLYNYNGKQTGPFPGADPDYIHLCKCWSYIFSGKIIKKYRNTHFLHQIIVFFSSTDRKDYKFLGLVFTVVILPRILNVFACSPCGKNCLFQKHFETQ